MTEQTVVRLDESGANVEMLAPFLQEALRHLKGGRLSVYLCLALHCDREMACTLTLAHIMEKTGYSRDVVGASLDILEHAGLIEQDPYHDGAEPGTVYRIKQEGFAFHKLQEPPPSSNREDILNKTGGHCAYCGKDLKEAGRWEVDHVKPRAAGGTDSYANLVPACVACNQSKAGRGPEEYRRSILEGQATSLDWIINALEPYGPEGELGAVVTRLRYARERLWSAELRFYMERMKD